MINAKIASAIESSTARTPLGEFFFQIMNDEWIRTKPRGKPTISNPSYIMGIAKAVARATSSSDTAWLLSKDFTLGGINM
jgi:hypothetical protein